ncbi:hypothetical protein FA13DRAFT_1732271 [Coprinellus micaceus]|uniref:Uncharacterized protein n=1 Tax=Coprinellus micaceus TaxID=71717 RepID=A0A4Y7TCX2_COPMI|nr:hypothetical protein FA13DRAFT_1732271 [Coprinellus micaceus]
MKGEGEADLDLWRSYRLSLKHLHTPVTFLSRPRPQIAAQLQRDRPPSVKNRLQVSRKCQPSTISSSLHHTRISSPASFFPILRLPILSQSLYALHIVLAPPSADPCSQHLNQSLQFPRSHLSPFSTPRPHWPLFSLSHIPLHPPLLVPCAHPPSTCADAEFTTANCLLPLTSSPPSLDGREDLFLCRSHYPDSSNALKCIHPTRRKNPHQHRRARMCWPSRSLSGSSTRGLPTEKSATS